jgi:hypothetical protein
MFLKNPLQTGKYFSGNASESQESLERMLIESEKEGFVWHLH